MKASLARQERGAPPEARRSSTRELIATSVSRARDHDVYGLAGELAYRASLAVFPFLLVVASLPSVLGTVFSIQDVGERLTDRTDSLLSESSSALVKSLIDEVNGSGGVTAFVMGILGALWAGTGVTSALRKSLNRLYSFDDQTSFFERKMRELALTLATGSLFLLAFVVILIGPQAIGGVTVPTQTLSLVVSLVLVLTAVSLLYWLAPAGDSTFRWVTPGAALFGVAWVVFTFGFSAYLSIFGTLNQVYGTLGAMIALLIWLYGSNLALLLGAELNAVIGRRIDPKVRRDAVGEPSHRGTA